MVDLKKELLSSQTILLTMSDKSYNQRIIETMKELSGKSICYVTSNKTASSLKELFKKERVDMENVVFVDAISKTFKETPETDEKIYFVDSPGALTELSLVIKKFLDHDFEYLVFDSLTNLTIYNKTPICAKFMNNLISKIKKTNTKTIFYVLGSEKDDLIKHASTFVDKVIKID